MGVPWSSLLCNRLIFYWKQNQTEHFLFVVVQVWRCPVSVSIFRLCCLFPADQFITWMLSPQGRVLTLSSRDLNQQQSVITPTKPAELMQSLVFNLGKVISWRTSPAIMWQDRPCCHLMTSLTQISSHRIVTITLKHQFGGLIQTL